MELSQRIHFWYQISLKMSIFGRKQFLNRLQKSILSSKCWTLLEIMLKRLSSDFRPAPKWKSFSIHNNQTVILKKKKIFWRLDSLKLAVKK